jgi:uncharacterized repeat protein (TIGR01451 family)
MASSWSGRAYAVAPPNDLCSGAEIIPGGGAFPYLTAVTADITDATTLGDPAPSCQALFSRSIWYSFTPTVSASYTFSTCNPATQTTLPDTVIALYTSSTGTCGGLYTQVTNACNDDFCSQRSQTSAFLTAGTRYFLLASKYGTNAPSPGATAMQIQVTQSIPPQNDTCSSPTTLPLNTILTGSLTAAQNDFQISTAAPDCYTLPVGPPAPVGQTPSVAAGRDVVYSFTAPSTGRFSFKAQNTVDGGDLVVGVASNCPTGASPNTLSTTCLGASNRVTATIGGVSTEEVTCLSMTAGQSVFVYVDETATATAGGAFAIEASQCTREIEPNNTPGTANSLGCGVEASMSPAGDIDFFTLGVQTTGSRVFALADGAASNNNDFDLRITTATDTLEYDDADNSAFWGSTSPNIAGRSLTGVLSFLRMNHFSGLQAEPYQLYSVIQPPGSGLGGSSAIAETEPNGPILANANATAGMFFSGNISTSGPGGDVDLFKFCAEAGDSIFLSVDGDPTRNNTPLDATVLLFNNAGTSLLASGDTQNTSNTTLSPGTLTGTSPRSPGESAVYRAGYTGTFYAAVNSTTTGFSYSTGDYLYSIALNCLRGNQLTTDLGIAVTAPAGPIMPLDALPYTINVTNAGPKTALDATWTTTIPANTTYVGISAPADWTCTQAAGVVTCTTSCFPKNTSAQFTLNLRATQCPGTSVAFAASVSTKTSDTNNLNNTAMGNTSITDPCNDGNVCTNDSCMQGVGCVYVNNSAACNDGNACTSSDVCVAGACTGGIPKVCADGNVCTNDSCNPTDGTCIFTNNTASCSDGNACNGVEVCGGGMCNAGTPLDCNDNNGCTDDLCNAATGCANTPNTAACNDGNACTSGDTCAAGSCVGGQPTVCNDNNGCTDDSCNMATGCVFTNNTASCSDGNACNGVEVCGGGMCNAGTPLDCNDNNGCTDDACNAATGCANTPNTAACDDGNACTSGDICAAGSCVAGAPTVCNDNNGCTDDSCDMATGCVFTNNTAPCGDGDVCNGLEVCGGGMCNVGTPLNCNDNNGCTDDACNAVTGCANTPNTAACDDGNACTSGDTCTAGGCVGGSPIVCNDNNPCTDDSCNAATGCVFTNNTDPCSDGNACTQNDVCQAGSCVAGTPVTCTALDQCHVPGTCNPATGVCDNPNADDGTSCNDGNACTQSDTCLAGACNGANPVTCTPLDQCHIAGTCDPATGVCDNPNAADGTTCSDGDACTQVDTCQMGSCSGANPVTCLPLDQCHVAGTCNPATGVCSNPNADDGTSCNDSNACTQSDTCQAGACTGANPITCTPLDQCHVAGTCDPATGVCDNPNAADGTICSDGDACTQVDTCQMGSCSGANPVTCLPLDQCHVPGTCNPATGVCSNPNADDGTNCNDGNACTQTDACQVGVCAGTNPITCTALDQCHVPGTCNPATGVCSNPNADDGTNCNDGNACTQTDACQVGVCTGTNPVTCTALDQCHIVGTCDPMTGTCNNPNANDGTPCADGNACTQTDTCQAGACTGTNPVTCLPLDQCHVAGTCDSATGTCSNPPIADGTNCNDGDACTQADSCQTGVCLGTNPVVCTALDQCHLPGTCDSATGTCSNPIMMDGTVCNDDDLCTQVDTCQAGSCVGANPVQCMPIDQCHSAGTCDPITGQCSKPNAPDGTMCSDGDGCTQTDTCQLGECVGANPITCTVQDECHVAGKCIPMIGMCDNPAKPDGTPCTNGTCQAGTCTMGSGGAGGMAGAGGSGGMAGAGGAGGMAGAGGSGGMAGAGGTGGMAGAGGSGGIAGTGGTGGMAGASSSSSSSSGMAGNGGTAGDGGSAGNGGRGAGPYPGGGGCDCAIPAQSSNSSNFGALASALGFLVLGLRRRRS